MRSQSAVEYLVTYSWAILILAVAVGVLFYLGVFNPTSLTNTQCIFPAGISCRETSLAPNGILTINFEQATESPVNVTAIGCATSLNSTAQLLVPQVYLPIGGAENINVQCYLNNAPFTGKIGSTYQGYIIVNYTDTINNFNHQVVGTIITKVT